MGLSVSRFCAVFFAALAMAPAMAHLLALPNKIGMSHDAYLHAQQIYRGWALLGVIDVAALASALVLAIAVRGNRGEFFPALAGFLCLVAAQAVFWLFTYPTNVRTAQWTMLPDDWMALRGQWELSHAVGAVLTLLALVVLIRAVVVRER